MTSRRWVVAMISRHSFRPVVRTIRPTWQDTISCGWVPSIRTIATTNSSSSSSSSSTGNVIDLKGLTPIDIEKELFKIKRRMGGYYSKGLYSDALNCAIELERIVADEMGTKNAIYASCLNNVALMNKMLGHTDIAMNKYTEALHTYEDVVGKKHPSYISTLANLGVLYKTLAESSTGMERLQLIERADESLADSLKLRQELLGTTNKDTLISANHLSSLWRLVGRTVDAEQQLRHTLTIARNVHGDLDSITATTLNNLGMLLKGETVFDMKQNEGSDKKQEYNEYNPRLVEAESCYREALSIRSQTLGDPHPDTIISMHNLAELLLVVGKQQEATELQEKIIQLVEHPNTATSSSSSTTKIPVLPHSNSNDPPSMVSVTKTSAASAAETAGLGPGSGSESGKGSSSEINSTHTRRKPEKNVLPPQVTYATRPKKNQS